MTNVIKQIVRPGEYGTQTIKMIVRSNERGPKGEKGDPGDGATVTAGQAYSIPASQQPSVMNTGTPSNAVFDFYIPEGKKGEDGKAATIQVGQTTTLAPGRDASVQNIGTSSEAIFNFKIPRGATGAQGAQGVPGPRGLQGLPGKDGAIQYVAGTGIQITDDNVIQATGAAVATWGGIQGTMSDQTDLQSALNAKQDVLTAGDAINITGNVISADIYPADFFTAGETLTGTGSNITLNETIPVKLKGVELYGDTFQQTYSGKNLFNKDATPTTKFNDNSLGVTPLTTGVRLTANASVTYSGVVYIIGKKEDYIGNTLTFTAHSKSSSTNNSRAYIGTCNSGGGNRTSKANGTGNSGEYDFSLSWTVENDDSNEYICVTLYTTASVSVSMGDYMDYTDVQLEVGSTATSYEPYVGGTASPNPSYPQTVNLVTGEQTIKMRGKNLLDVPDGTSTIRGLTFTRSGNTIVCSGTRQSTGNNWFVMTGDWVTLDTPFPVATYTFSIGEPTTKDIEFSMKYSDGSITSYTIRSGSTSVTFTTTLEIAQYRLVAVPFSANEPASGVAYKDIQLEAGSHATDFEKPPKSYIVNLGSTELCKIGDYQDYIYKSGDDWYVHKENAKIVLDGTEAGWAVSHNKEAYLAISDAKGNNTRTYSNLFTNNPSAVTETATWGEYRFGGTNNNLIFFMAVVENTDLAGFKTWLASHNTIVYYQLATPTDTKITDNSLIGQLNTLASANAYLDTTHFLTTATGTNLPVILDIVAYKKSLDGVINSIPNAQVQSNWTQADTTAPDYIKNKPSIPAAQIQSDWDQADNSAVDYIKNKPTIPTVNDATLTIQQNGVDITTFTANASSNATANITSPVITMTTTDPGEGSVLADNNYIGVYGGDPIIMDYSITEVNTGAKWINGSAIYKKTVNTGALPNATSATVAHGISNLSKIIRLEGYALRSTDNVMFPLPFASPTGATADISVTVNGTNIAIATGIDRSNIAESYITLYYTKSS